MARGPSHCAVLLEILGDGEPHTSSEILRGALERCGGMIVHSRVADLRRRGYTIECVHLDDVSSGAGAYSYRLLAEPAAAATDVRDPLLRAPAPKDSPEEGESAAGVSEFVAPLAVEEGTASGLRSAPSPTAVASSPFADLEVPCGEAAAVAPASAAACSPTQLRIEEAA